MKYYPVNELKKLSNVEEMIELSRLLWYKIAEQIETVSSYKDYVELITRYETNNWQLSIEIDGTITFLRNDTLGSQSIQIDKSGRQVYKIIPIR
ncbi:hypothetical protein ACLM5H_01285 [Fredinandcohnia humi]